MATLKMPDKIKGPLFLNAEPTLPYAGPALPAEDFAGRSKGALVFFPRLLLAPPKIKTIIITVIVTRPPRGTDPAEQERAGRAYSRLLKHSFKLQSSMQLL